MGRHFIDGDRIAWDTETTGLNPWQGDAPFAFSFTNEGGETKYFEFRVNPFTRKPIPDKLALKNMAALLEDTRIAKVCHNANFDIRMMEMNYGIKTRGKLDDTIIMAHNCNTLEPQLGLKPLSKKYADVPDDDQKVLHKATVRLRRKAAKVGWKIAFDHQPMPHGDPKKKAQVPADYWLGRTMAYHHPELIMDGDESHCETYARLDSERTMMLYMMYRDLIEELDLKKINKIEMDLWPVIYKMVTRGVCTDTAKLRVQMKEAVAEMDRLLPSIEAATWKGFRPKRDEDVRKCFYDILGFAVEKMTKGGKRGDKKKPAVDKFVILAHIDNPVVRDIAIWKANYTAFGTFFSKFERLSVPDLCGGETALHCDYRQVGPATGRLSSATPNLQNVMTPENTMAVHPIHVRPAFIPRPGYRWLCVDYEGMEIRMYAAISKDPTMMKAIKAGVSIHDMMTNIIWGGPNNEEALKQAVRALSLDGTGMHTSKQVDALWKEWGVTDKNVYGLSEKRKYEIADLWLKKYNYDQVKAQSSVGRKNSKTTIKSLSFLKIYRGGAKKAALLLKSTPEEAARTLALYDEKFPDIEMFCREFISKASKDGYITSVWGRRLEIDPLYAYRAVNYMVQGSSADLMKMSLIRTDDYITKQKLDAFVLMTIHDEIVFEVAKADLTKPFVRTICGIMADTQGHLPIEMTVEPKMVTQNWSIKEKIDWQLKAKAA